MGLVVQPTFFRDFISILNWTIGLGIYGRSYEWQGSKLGFIIPLMSYTISKHFFTSSYRMARQRKQRLFIFFLWHCQYDRIHNDFNLRKRNSWQNAKWNWWIIHLKWYKYRSLLATIIRKTKRYRNNIDQYWNTTLKCYIN